jgi:hypothetical protein
MSRAQEHAPTEPQPAVPPSGSPTPTATTQASTGPGRRSGARASGTGYDPVARIALVIIAAILVIFLILALTGFPFHVKVEKGGKSGGGHRGSKVTQSANP